MITATSRLFSTVFDQFSQHDWIYPMFWPAMCFWRAIMLRLCWRHLLKGWNIAKSWRIWWCAKCWKTVLWAGAIICQLLSMEFYNWGNAKCWLCNIQAHMVQMQALYWDGVLGVFCIWDNVIVSWNMWLKALWTWKLQCIAGNKMIILFDQFKTLWLCHLHFAKSCPLFQ